MKAKLLATCLALCAGSALAADETSKQTWRYFAAGAADNPYPNRACITNGTAWALAVDVVSASARTLKIACAGTAANAYLTDPSSADTLDLRGTVFGAEESETWTITAIDVMALGGDSEKGTAAALITPGTLVGNFEQWFKGFTVNATGATVEECYANYTAITVDEPNLAGSIKARVHPRTTAGVRWTVRVPKVTGICDWSLSVPSSGDNSLKPSGTFLEDSFLSVAWFYGNAFSNRKFDGVLNLPAVTSIDAWACNGNDPGFCEIRLSEEARALTNLGSGCFGWLSATTNVVLGLAANNTVAAQVFNSLQNLRRVEFTGAPPNFTGTANDVFTGPATDTLTFIVPPSAAWAAYLEPFEASGDFKRWSGDEISAWRAEHPEGPVVIGTVNGNVFKSNNRHYLAVSDRVSSWRGVDIDAALGSVEAKFVVDDTAPFRVALSLTARPSEGARFAGWYGDVPDGKCADATILLREADPSSWAFARFTRPWTLTADASDATKAILDNGIFRIQVTVDAATRNLTLGRSTACSLYAPDNTGDGVLDLGGAITDASGNVYRIVSLGTADSVLSSSSADAVPGARVFVTPGTLTKCDERQLFHATNRRATYESVVFDEPTATGGLNGWTFSDQKSLKHVVFRCPAWTLPYNLNGLFFSTRVAETDVGWWKLDGVRQFGSGSNNNMHGTDWSVNGKKAWLTGSLKLPSVAVLGGCVCQNNLLDEAWLGHGSAKTRVTEIKTGAFQASGITNLVLNAARDLTVAANAFADTPNLKTVTFLGHVVSADAFAAILSCATAEAPAVVYASDAYGWGQASFLGAPTEAERAAAPAGETVLGVWRGADGTDGVRAWVCDRDSLFPRKGTFFIVR